MVKIFLRIKTVCWERLLFLVFVAGVFLAIASILWLFYSSVEPSVIARDSGKSLISFLTVDVSAAMFALVGAVSLALLPFVLFSIRGFRVGSWLTLAALPLLNKIILIFGVTALPGLFFGLLLFGHFVVNWIFAFFDFHYAFYGSLFIRKTFDWELVGWVVLFFGAGILLFRLLNSDIRPLFFIGSEKIWATLDEGGKHWRLHLRELGENSVHGEVGRMMKFVARLPSEYRPERIEMASHIFCDPTDTKETWLDFIYRRAGRMSYEVWVGEICRYSCLQRWLLAHLVPGLKQKYREGRLVGYRKLVLTKSVG